MRPASGRASIRPLILILWVLLVPVCVSAATSTLPIPTMAPSATRAAIVRTAEALKGIPYRLGGEAKSGFDCSGLVYYVFDEAIGRQIPRTVAQQAAWVLHIPKKELQAGDLVFFSLSSSSKTADHVGIYAGDGAFIHAASAGSKTGVTRNSLSEASWSRRFLFAGRVVSASAFSGVAVDWFAGALLDEDIAIDAQVRGAELMMAAALPLGRDFSIGLQGGAAWDNLLDVVRVPVNLTLGQISGISIFGGPAFTIGEPLLPAESAGRDDRRYTAGTGWVTSIGIRWSPLLFRQGTSAAGIYSEMRFDRYFPAAGQPEDRASDRRAALTFGVGLRFRSIRY